MLYDIYNDKRDASAAQLLKGNRSEAVRLWKQAGAEAVHEILEKEKKNFWNQEFQREQAAKSMRHPNAIQIRSEGGKKGGYNAHRNQIVKLEDRYLFSFQHEELLCVFNCETGGDVVRELNKAHETRIVSVSSLIQGKRSSSYGWTVIKISA